MADETIRAGCSPQRAAAMREARDAKVLDAAVTVASDAGVHALTRVVVAGQAGVSEATVSNALGTMAQVREAVMREAIRRPVLNVLAQGLALGDPIARDAPDDLKQAALATVSH